MNTGNIMPQTIAAQDGLATVTGYILPEGWADDYSVSSVLIADNSEQEFIVGNLGDYPELVRLCRCKVAATGYIYSRQGKTYFDLATYVVVEGDTAKEQRHDA
ncbi:conserved hypothetical protein [Nitratidesulfovibrio vulgaris DP4]|jgi:hypothetical protein|nr:conserved hypothetical protein [Nitratidesulfovibrio vulgaris DP4]